MENTESVNSEPIGKSIGFQPSVLKVIRTFTNEICENTPILK